MKRGREIRKCAASRVLSRTCIEENEFQICTIATHSKVWLMYSEVCGEIMKLWKLWNIIVEQDHYQRKVKFNFQCGVERRLSTSR